jgi:3-mercaptopyruvate sulfurtransferase SseA
MRHRTLPSPRSISLAVAAVAAVVAACATSRSGEPFTMVSMDQVARMIGDPKVAVIDANPREVYEGGHVPGARWYRSGPSLAAVLPADRSTKLVFYCASPS